MERSRIRKGGSYAVDLLESMLKIYSPSGREEEVSSFLEAELRRLGFKAWRDEVGNVLGEASFGDGPKVLLCGHVDTVPGELPVKLEGGRLYGRGAVDAKGPLASMVASAARLLEAGGLEGTLTLAALVDEEGSGRGAKNLVKRGVKADYAVFGEPSGTKNVVIGYKGSLRLKVSCRTEGGHSASAWMFENAIEAGFKVWRAIEAVRHPKERLDSKFYSITSCLTRIHGGSSFSVVPSECELEVDVRVPPQIHPMEVLAMARGAALNYARKGPKLKVEVEALDWVEGFEGDEGSDLVKAFVQAIRKVKKCQVALLRKTGTSDMNLLAKKLRAPAVAYGPGDSRLDHSPRESIKVEDLLDGARVYEGALRRLLGGKLGRY